MATLLRDDALTSSETGTTIRVSFPWIRSLPLWCVQTLRLQVNSIEQPVTLRIGDGVVSMSALASQPDWWFLQDRLLVHTATPLDAGTHRIRVDLALCIPYLDISPDAPLVLPFRTERELVCHANTPAPAATALKDIT